VSLFAFGRSIKLTATGPSGLVAMKNLKEEGFNVTGFDRNSYVGGLWQFTAENQTSVMETTIVNISRERVGLVQMKRFLTLILTTTRVASLISHLAMVSEFMSAKNIW
jgi:ribulose 1,5-bisphosphate synthetase/thiazole synthase